MAKVRTIEVKPVMYVVSDRQSGAVVLTHRTVSVGFGSGTSPVSDGEEHVMGLLKRLKVPNLEALAIEKIDPASWDGESTRARPAKAMRKRRKGTRPGRK